MRLYLAGPMTDLPELNHPLFHSEAARLRALGFEIVNPAEVAPDKTMAWIECMLLDLPEVKKCDGIALLPGWQSSNGARIEHCVTVCDGKHVFMAADLVVGPSALGLAA